jgi:hypothetical protein
MHLSILAHFFTHIHCPLFLLSALGDLPSYTHLVGALPLPGPPPQLNQVIWRRVL